MSTYYELTRYGLAGQHGLPIPGKYAISRDVQQLASIYGPVRIWQARDWNMAGI